MYNISLIPFLFAVIPSILIVRYFYLQDINKPEPIHLIVKVFFMGILCTIPVIILEMIVSEMIKPLSYNVAIFSFAQAFIVAGLCEESMKLMVVLFFIYNNRYFDEVMDGIVYTIVASLGFACLENIMYVSEGGISTAFLRSFTAVPLHAFCSGIMGYYIGKSKFYDGKNYYLLKGLFIAIFIHGCYNFVLFIGGIYSFIIFPILFSSYKKLKFCIESAIEEDLKNFTTTPSS